MLYSWYIIAMHELVSPFQNLDTFGTFKSPFMNILRVFECIYCSLYSYIVIFFVFVSGVVLGSIEPAMTFFFWVILSLRGRFIANAGFWLFTALDSKRAWGSNPDESPTFHALSISGSTSLTFS